MANPEHEAILRQGVVVWNQWREDHPNVEPDLSAVQIGRLFYADVNLSHTNFARAYIAGTSLMNADLSFTNLEGATLFSVSPTEANFTNANLKSAHLTNVRFTQSNLTGVKFKDAVLQNVDLSGAILNDAVCNATIFVSVNFTKATGLEQVQHRKKSMITVDSIVNSKGALPDVFLRGCGVPEKLIAALPSLLEL